jgi:large subunit ribosomal protein L18
MKTAAKSKNSMRKSRHARVRAVVTGTAARPRLSVFKSNKFVSAQVIDDAKGVTIAAAHGREFKGSQTKQAEAIGAAIAERAKAKGIETVVFDRGGYNYAGQIKALADAARAGGLAL